MNHSPTPWTYYRSSDSNLIQITDNNGLLVCYDEKAMNPNANAALIVRAVNSYERLVSAAKTLVNYRRRAGVLGFQLEKADDYFEELEAALAATEEPTQPETER